MGLTIKVDPGEKVRLAKTDTDRAAGLTKSAGNARLAALSEQLGELQELLFAAHRHAVLIVLQGMDTSGKDGTIKHVMSHVNPLGCRVEAFKVPSEEELAHDFLWRVHKVAPARGHLALFNRSHYEDVIAVRVHRLAPEDVWRPRYAQINEFERSLAAAGTIVVKLYLHISREEQHERLVDREKNPLTAWKLNVNDWRELPLWDETTAAYEDALTRCSSPELPFYLVPADRKWFRNLAVFERLVLALRPYRDGWLRKLKKERHAALKEIRLIRRHVERGKK